MDEHRSSLAKKIFKKQNIIVGILLILVLNLAAVAMYFYSQYQQAQAVIKNPNLTVEKQTKELVAKVGQLMVLPKDEQPTVATVVDAAKLKDQAFFKNAQNGYKVLIYVKAKKAILYDPVKNVIVDFAPVNISQNDATPTQAAAPLEKVSPTQSAVIPTSSPTSAPVSPTTTK